MEWRDVLSSLGLLLTLFVAARVMLRDRGLDATALAAQLVGMKASMDANTAEVARLRETAETVIRQGVQLDGVRADLHDIRNHMRTLAAGDKVLGELAALDERLRTVERQVAQIEAREARRS